MIKKIMGVLSVCMILALAACSNEEPKQQGELYEKNPVDVCQRYIENLTSEDKLKYVYSDMNKDGKRYTEYSGYFEQGYFLVKDFTEEKEIKQHLKYLRGQIKECKMEYVKPSDHINMLSNPLVIKNEEGEVKKYKNPVVLDVYFKITHHKDKYTAYNEGDEMKTIVLVPDEYGNYKVLSVGH